MINALIERSQYPCLAEYAYLNQASLGLIGGSAMQTMHAFLDTVARHGNLNLKDEDELALIATLREEAAVMLNCSNEEVAVMACASELLGQLPLIMQPPKGSDILVVSSDFPALTRPWLAYAQKSQCTVRLVTDAPNENLTDTLLEAINSSTAVIAVSLVQFATGSQIDVLKIRDACKQNGVRFVLDVTQAAGCMQMDAREWQADAVVTSGYKWLGGHGGVALAALSPSLIEEAVPLPGWLGAPDPFDFDATSVKYAEGGMRFTQSTLSYVSVAGLTAALKELQLVSMNDRVSHARALAQKLEDEALLNGWMPFRRSNDESASANIVTLVKPSANLNSSVDALRKNNVVCGIRNGRLRVSLAAYNDGSDIDALARALPS